MHTAALLIAAAFLAPHGDSPGGDSPRAPLGRVGDGAPTCGLGKEFHAGRRAAVREALGEGVFVVSGLSGRREMLRFAQDKVFWWLTGIESPGAALVMDLDAGTEVLFLPASNRGGESWNGEMWDAGDEWVRELSGFSDVRPRDELEALVGELGKGRKVWISKHPEVSVAGAYDNSGPFDRSVATDPLDGRTSRAQALETRIVALTGAKPEDAARAINRIRLVKQPEEIAAMRRAAEAGALAQIEAIRTTRPGLGEWDIEALMTFIHGREGADGPAYGAIVGSGPNSLVLHYMHSSRRMLDGDILLVDYGPEVDHFVTDITRTWPVNGRFTKRQAELYDAVLAAQQAGIDAAKPGATLFSVGQAATRVLNERGFDGKSGFQRHGVCHWVGMEVHDPGTFGAELVPGMAFTVEPGLYESATAIGIRIEDVVLITEDGCEVLSAAAPRERKEIEKLMRDKGLLERLGPPSWE